MPAGTKGDWGGLIRYPYNFLYPNKSTLMKPICDDVKFFWVVNIFTSIKYIRSCMTLVSCHICVFCMQHTV